MDFQTKALLTSIVLALIGFATLVVILRYCRWLHERDVEDPEARAAILLNARSWLRWRDK